MRERDKEWGRGNLNQLAEGQCNARSWGRRDGSDANECGVPFWSDENDVELGSVDVCRPCKYNKTHQVEHFKRVNLMACELYISQFFKK